MSKRVVVEKEPVTLEKENENLSKYYLSYPRLPVLNMKLKNHGINVVEWANVPKFPPLLSVKC